MTWKFIVENDITKKGEELIYYLELKYHLK